MQRALASDSPVHDGAGTDVTDPTFVARFMDSVVRRGYVVVRNYSSSPEEFARVSASLPFAYVPHRYALKGAGEFRREVIGEDSSLATVTGGPRGVGWHQELGYCPRPPGFLLFWCEVAPPAGTGQTLVVDGERLFASLPDSDANRLRSMRFRWRRRFNRQDETEVSALYAMLGWAEGADPEASCAAEQRDLPFGVSLTITADASTITYEIVCPVVCTTRWSRRPAVCTQLKSVRAADPFGRAQIVCPDGGGVPEALALVDSLMQAADDFHYAHEWRAGDLLIIDNCRCMHARRELNGSAPRRILARLAHPRTGTA
jgi:alpha-ketoglutarate-dependent taurine dioxygenase